MSSTAVVVVVEEEVDENNKEFSRHFLFFLIAFDDVHAVLTSNSLDGVEHDESVDRILGATV